MELTTKTKGPWYVGGLHFGCAHCGRCCSGPGEGYIWVTRREIELIADYLRIPITRLRSDYLKRVGLRLSIVEDVATKDCIFLTRIDGERKCRIYPVRPNQCRTWPFWPSNLTNTNVWNEAARRCAGVDRGRLYSFEEIEKIRKSKKWWQNGDGTD
jgi:Fe-S-cluster containining protein